MDVKMKIKDVYFIINYETKTLLRALQICSTQGVVSFIA